MVAMKSGKVEISLLVVVAASLMPLLPAFQSESLPGRLGYQASAQTTPEDASKSQADNKKAEETSEATKAPEAKEATGAADAPVEVVEETEIISISDALKQGQLAHEKNLVNKFLLGIAVLFLLIAFLLFNSLPPSSPESGSN